MSWGDENDVIPGLLARATNKDDLREFKRLLQDNLEYLRYEDGTDEWLSDTAGKGLLPFVKLLIEDFGIGVNESSYNKSNFPSVAIEQAASEGHYDVVKYLLEKGATINLEYIRDNPKYKGVKICFALRNAVSNNHLDIVKLLIEEHDADINTPWGGVNTICDARSDEMFEYLRSQGAKFPTELMEPNYPACHETICDMMIEQCGSIKAWSLVDKGKKNAPDVTIHLCCKDELEEEQTLFTTGLSDVKLDVQDDEGGTGRDNLLTELTFDLPTDWEISNNSMQDPLLNWSILAMQQIAREALTTKSWQADDVTILMNDNNAPFATNTKLCSWLLIGPTNGNHPMPDGRWVDMRQMIPIYKEEAALIKTQGIKTFNNLFYDHDKPINPTRKNVAIE